MLFTHVLLAWSGWLLYRYDAETQRQLQFANQPPDWYRQEMRIAVQVYGPGVCLFPAAAQTLRTYVVLRLFLLAFLCYGSAGLPAGPAFCGAYSVALLWAELRLQTLQEACLQHAERVQRDVLVDAATESQPPESHTES